jgi:hypothetical protein
MNDIQTLLSSQLEIQVQGFSGIKQAINGGSTSKTDSPTPILTAGSARYQ